MPVARHRTAGSTGPCPVVERALRTAPVRTVVPEDADRSRTAAPATVASPVLVLRRVHRLPVPPAALRGRVVVAAAAVGAFVAAAHSVGSSPATSSPEVTLTASGSSTTGTGGAAPALPQVLTVTKRDDAVAVTQLAKAERLGAERAAREAQARRPLYVLPAVGTVTSGFGGRWGTFHYGVDIANAIGTPIVSVADGLVLDAGPASGFGQWVRVQLDDGTIVVYGHVDSFLAHAGDRVEAGQEIATIGNRGQSTGPHLHFEVWMNGTDKVDPLPWLAERGIHLS